MLCYVVLCCVVCCVLCVVCYVLCVVLCCVMCYVLCYLLEPWPNTLSCGAHMGDTDLNLDHAVSWSFSPYTCPCSIVSVKKWYELFMSCFYQQANISRHHIFSLYFVLVFYMTITLWCEKPQNCLLCIWV